MNRSNALLNDDGFLPEGIYDLTLEEIKSSFGRFRGTNRRVKLFSKLETYVESLRQQEWFRGLIVDGSFVTSKPDPSDIDLILLVDTDRLDEAIRKPIAYNMVSRKRVRKKYGFDVLCAGSGSAEFDYWVDFFSQIRGTDSRKGLVRLVA